MEINSAAWTLIFSLSMVSSNSDIQCPNECASSVCTIEENPNCINYQNWGCTECEDGYFSNNYGSPCSSCDTVFNGNCLECNDWKGCMVCKSGTERMYDPECGLYYCHQSENYFTCPTECTGNVCTSEENPHCLNQQSWGCVECEDEYFYNNQKTPCTLCDQVFGNNVCLECNNFHGCLTCNNGYIKKYDQDCGLFYCFPTITIQLSYAIIHIIIVLSYNLC